MRQFIQSVTTKKAPRAGDSRVVGHFENWSLPFVSGSEVKFGSLTLAAASVSFVSGTELKVVAPAESAGTVDVRVWNPAGYSPAVSAELIEFDAVAIRFRHPLIRSGIYQQAELTERMAVHAALAETLASEPDRSIWHKAAATIAPNEEVAAHRLKILMQMAGFGIWAAVAILIVVAIFRIFTNVYLAPLQQF